MYVGTGNVGVAVGPVHSQGGVALGWTGGGAQGLSPLKGEGHKQITYILIVEWGISRNTTEATEYRLQTTYILSLLHTVSIPPPPHTHYSGTSL